MFLQREMDQGERSWVNNPMIQFADVTGGGFRGLIVCKHVSIFHDHLKPRGGEARPGDTCDLCLSGVLMYRRYQVDPP